MSNNELRKRHKEVIRAVNILVSLCTTVEITCPVVALYIDNPLNLRNFNTKYTFQKNVSNGLGLSLRTDLYGYLLVYMDDVHICMLLWSKYGFATPEMFAVYFECDFVTGGYKYESIEYDYGKWRKDKKCCGVNGFESVFETMWRLFYRMQCYDDTRQGILRALHALSFSWIH